MSGALNSRTSCFKLRCLQNVQRCSKRSLHFKCAGHWSGPFPFKTHNLLRAFQRSADVHGFSKIQTVLEYHIVQEIVILKDISARRSSDFAKGESLFCMFIGDELLDSKI